jgi:NADH-quinone oxidoreductase subunit J
MGPTMIFYLLALLATVCSIMVVASRNPVTSAIYLVCDLFILAAIYATLNADFVAAIQVIVYAGAVVVLFVFVIMLLNLEPDQREALGVKLPDIGFTLLTVLCFFTIVILVLNQQPVKIVSQSDIGEVVSQSTGNTHSVGVVLFSKFVWPFEMASFLILASIVGAVFIAKKDKKKAENLASKNIITKETLPNGAP